MNKIDLMSGNKKKTLNNNMEVDLLLQREYSKKLEEQIEIMEQMLELKDKTININNEHIKELKNQIEELMELLDRAIEATRKNI